MSNDKGQWFGWDVTKVGPVKDNAVYRDRKTICWKSQQRRNSSEA